MQAGEVVGAAHRFAGLVEGERHDQAVTVDRHALRRAVERQKHVALAHLAGHFGHKQAGELVAGEARLHGRIGDRGNPRPAAASAPTAATGLVKAILRKVAVFARPIEQLAAARNALQLFHKRRVHGFRQIVEVGPSVVGVLVVQLRAELLHRPNEGVKRHIVRRAHLPEQLQRPAAVVTHFLDRLAVRGRGRRLAIVTAAARQAPMPHEVVDAFLAAALQQQD